jgi:hypothetical protein
MSAIIKYPLFEKLGFPPELFKIIKNGETVNNVRITKKYKNVSLF